MWRSSVLSLALQLVFPDKANMQQINPILTIKRFLDADSRQDQGSSNHNQPKNPWNTTLLWISHISKSLDAGCGAEFLHIAEEFFEGHHL